MEPDQPVNYVISEEDRLGQGGAKTKFRDNVKAILTLKKIRENEAAASPEDLQALVRYVGWGGLPQAFDSGNADWKNEYGELRELLSVEEYAAARRSTQDAHYTSKEVIRGIYQGLDRLGFKGPASIIEPSAGPGNFLGLMPEDWRDGEKNIVAVELDPIPAEIGRRLYPETRYLNKGFQETVIPDGSFDLAIGNPPFGKQKIYDSSKPELDFSIHNYFLAKSIDSLRDGGLAAFVVSRYFLDAAGNPAREYIAERANFLGAIRLPNTAFKQNALTEVTTDICFFQKTNEPELEPSWLKTGSLALGDEGEITVNQYFLDHPGQMIGQMALTSNMFRDSADLLPPENFEGFAPEIEKRLDCLPREIYRPRDDLAFEDRPAKDDPNIEKCFHLKVDSFFITERGQVARRLPNVVDSSLGEIVKYELVPLKNRMAGERIAAMAEIRDCLSALMAYELSGDDEHPIESERRRLNGLYDRFVKRFGFINAQANRLTMRDDPEYPLLSSLEREYDPGVSKEAASKNGLEAKAPSAVKADIFYRRVLGPRPAVTRVETAKEALMVSMNEHGRVDIEFMSGLCGLPVEKITDELSGLIYLNPKTRAWETADHYLTGNVKQKLAEAQASAQSNASFKVNAAALEAVQPPDLALVDISVQLGSTWVPAETVADFCCSILGPEAAPELAYHPAMGQWTARFNNYAIDRTVNETAWGTGRYPASGLVAAILQYKPIVVRDNVGKDAQGRTIYKVNDEETSAAIQKAEGIKQAFEDWIWADQERREKLARLYNDLFNTNIPRKYDGSHLTLPGSSVNIALRPHQKNAIWRAIQDGGLMADQVVGSGKSFEIVGIIMESRRMGLMKKSMVVVPNHLLAQWRDAFYSLYPQAKILAAGKEDFKKENRERLFAKVATGDWDAVIVPHSSFKKIGLPPRILEKIINEQVNDLTDSIAELKRENGERYQIKAMEKMRENLRAKMARQAETGLKDQSVTFADLGIDALFVDESQEFKNLAFVSKMSNVAGLGNMSGSDKAFDLFVKVRHIQMENNGRGVFFATGTPISNSIAELYTVQRFLQYDLLKEKGLSHFDAWASTFGKVVSGWELDATGVGYRVKERFSRFQNVPELVSMYRTAADVVTQSDLAANNQGRAFTPKIKGGKPRNIVVKRSELQARYMGLQEQAFDDHGLPRFTPDGLPLMEWTPGSIIHRMENPPNDPRKDNPLKITNDARKAGLDFRLIDPDAPDFEGSKVNAAVDEITRLWQDWAADRGTQLVFCDLSTPKAAKRAKAADKTPVAEEAEEAVISMDEMLADGSDFSVYDDLKAKLVVRGIPAEQIRFIHEANTDLQKAKLFERVNQGEVRVLIGSTAKMGAGTNVQKRLVGLHHLDAPWRPSDLSQREGRIIRQGNMFFERDPENFEVEIIRYATEQTYDARMWQVVQVKAEGIEQFRKGDNLARTIDDVSGEAANAAEMKAAATGNELIFTQVRLASELKKLEGIYASFVRNQHKLDRRIASLEKAPMEAAKEIERWNKEIAHRNGHTTKEAFFAAGGQIYGRENRKELAIEIARQIKQAVKRQEEVLPVGQYRGFKVMVEGHKNRCQFMLGGQAADYAPASLVYEHGDKFSVQGFMDRLDNYLNKFEANIAQVEKERERKARELVIAKQSQGQSFPQMDLLEALRQDNREVIQELQLGRKSPDYRSSWTPKSDSLKAGELEKTPVPAPETDHRDPGEPASMPHPNGVAFIHVGDRGSFPVFDDRALSRTANSGLAL